MPENGRFPCGTDGLRLLATNAARKTPSGQDDGQATIRTPSDQDAQQARIVSGEQEGAKTALRALAWPGEG